MQVETDFVGLPVLALVEVDQFEEDVLVDPSRIVSKATGLACARGPHHCQPLAGGALPGLVLLRDDLDAATF